MIDLSIAAAAEREREMVASDSPSSVAPFLASETRGAMSPKPRSESAVERLNSQRYASAVSARSRSLSARVGGRGRPEAASALPAGVDAS